MNLEDLFRNFSNIGLTLGIVIGIGSSSVTIQTLYGELVQFPVSVFPDGVSDSDRVAITRCHIHGKTYGIILPPN